MEKTHHDIQSILESNETLDIKKFLFKVLANWYWFVLTLFIAVSYAFFVNKYTDPVYTVKASVLVRDKSNSNSSGIDNIVQELKIFDRIRRKTVENELGVLHSYTLIRRTVEKLDFGISYYSVGRIRQPELYQKKPFIVVVDTSKANIYDYPIHVTILNKDQYKLHVNDLYKIDKVLNFGQKFESKIFNFTIGNSELNIDSMIGNEYYFTINNINTLTNSYVRNLQLEITDEKSSIILLSTKGKIINKEVDFLNMLCDEYLQQDLDEKNEINEKTIRFIDEQLSMITDSLQFAENKLQSFKESNRIVNLSTEGQILFQKMEHIQQEKAEASVKQNYFNYLLTYITKNKDTTKLIAPSFMGVNDASLNKLIVELNELYSEMGALSFGGSKELPAMGMYDNKIKNLKKLIGENVVNIIKTNDITLDNLNHRLDLVDEEIRKLPGTEKNLINIQRKYKLNDEIYNYLLQKRAETGIAKASNTPENKILDYSRADNAAKISPKEQLNYMIAIILALLIPLIIIVMLDFFDNKIHERKDIEKRTRIPIIAEIGHNNKNSELVVFNHPRSSISESFRKLRTNLKYSLINKTDGPFVLSVTSTISGEGKSFIAVNTASVIAALEKKTVILGLDLRKPSLHKYFDFENVNGISEYLTGEIDYHSIIKPSSVTNLWVIPAGSIPPNPAELIELPQMAELIERLKQDFDYIVLDTPPIALVTDALLLSSLVDLNLFVIRQNYSNLSVLEFLNDVKQKNDININIIINDIDITGYYSYKYNYNYKYGGSYYSHNYYEDDIKLPIIFRLLKKFRT
jgi:capsular exopolysaccharide synthesis family protein